MRVARLSIGLGCIFATSKRNSNPATLVIEPRERFMGALPPAEIVCDFDVANYLPYDVEIVGISRSCGCTRASLGKSKLRHNEHATLHCQINLLGRAGDFVTAVSVAYRPSGAAAGTIKEFSCAIHANVIPKVIVSPSEVQFDAFTLGSAQLQLDLPSAASVTRVSVNHKALQADLSADGRHVGIRFNPAFWSEYNGIPEVSIFTTVPHEDHIRIPVIVSNRIAAAENPENFGRVSTVDGKLP